jgi:hypothetical protein
MKSEPGRPAEPIAVSGIVGRRFTGWSLLFGAFAVCWLAFFFLHPAELPKVGVGHYRIEVGPDRFHEIWFLDTFAILAANDAVSAGEDPYAPTRLDYMRRPHSYGPAWLYLRHLGLTRADVGWIGWLLASGFLLANLCTFRPQCGPATLWLLAFFCTTPVLAAIERGNNDLVVFLLLTPVVPCLLAGGPVLRWLAVPLIVVAAALKYYPAVAGLVLLAPAPTREVRRRIAVAALAFALAGWHVLTMVPGSGTLPKLGGLLSFGAVAISEQLGFEGRGPQLAVVALALAVIVFWWRSPILRDWQPFPAEAREWMYFVLGGVLLTGCFFVGQHFGYRWIFGLWLAPLLWSLPRDPHAPVAARRLARLMGWLLLILLWAEAGFVFAMHRSPQSEMMKAAKWMSLAMQPVTWAFFVGLLGFLTHFVRSRWAGLWANSLVAK